MLTRIDDIHLYMGMTADAAECYEAKKFLVDNGIAFVPYMYGDDSAHAGLFEALTSWNMPGAPAQIAKFPFLTYTEVHDNLPPSQYPRICVYGAAALRNSDIVTKYKIGR